MVKNGLIGLLKNTIRSAVLVGVMAVGLYGCKPDPLNVDPVAHTEVSPVSGVAPLSTRIKGYGTDADGLDDIVSYTLNVNGKDSTSSTPFDFTKVFSVSGTYNIFTVVSDSHGASNKSQVVSVVVSDKPPVTYNAPVVSFSADKTSGTGPLAVRFKVSGTDKDNDISSYRLYVDGKVDSSLVPIDTTIIFLPTTSRSQFPLLSSHNVYAEVVDKHKLSNQTSTTLIDVFQNGDSWAVTDPFPKNSRVNLFMSDSTMVEYNVLKDSGARNDYISFAAINDVCKRIPLVLDKVINGKKYTFACVEASGLFQFNRHDWPDLYSDGKKVFDGNMNENTDSVYVHSGIEKYRNTNTAPVFIAVVSDHHQQNYAFTGNDLRIGAGANLIEAPVAKTNLQPGQEGIPLDYPDFTLWYSYTFYKDGHNNLTTVPIAKYNLSGGVLHFVATNPNLDVILERDVPPVLNVRSPENGKTYAANSKILLDEVTVGKTFRYGYYSFDGGVTKTPIRQKEKMDLIYHGNRYFAAGNYSLSLYVKNEFFEDDSKTINFIVK
jgi:hypothetical protein